MNIDKQVIEQIIVADDTKKLVSEADRIGKFLAEYRPPLSSSQIRNVFGTVKQVSLSWTPQSKPEEAKAAHRQILLLKPKLAYQEGRLSKQQKETMSVMRQVLDLSIDLIKGDAKRFKRFAEFFEAILAYHKAYGGK